MIEDKPYYILDRLPRRIPVNYVLVKLLTDNKEAKTNSGIILASGRNDSKLDGDDVYHQIDRVGEVIICSKLYYNYKSHNSLEWDTECEIMPGDIVWMRQIESNCATRIQVGNNKFKIIRYDGLSAAKRNGEVICLNGLVLLKPYETEYSKLILTPSKNQNKHIGIVKYFGSKNKDYKSNWAKHIQGWRSLGLQDEVNVEIGDKVIINVPPVWLESDFINYFGERLKIAQRRNIIGILNE
jgi:co-chaperonin GroES (HSP10)